MVFIATQRCPVCKSSNTVVALVETQRTFLNHAAGKESQWTCSDCRLVFKPSNAHVSSPVLMCESCKVPTEHKFLRAARGVFKPVGESHATDIPIFHEIYACSCGSERIFGFANVPLLALAENVVSGPAV